MDNIQNCHSDISRSFVVYHVRYFKNEYYYLAEHIKQETVFENIILVLTQDHV
jgi:hypothetical protein